MVEKSSTDFGKKLASAGIFKMKFFFTIIFKINNYYCLLNIFI